MPIPSCLRASASSSSAGTRLGLPPLSPPPPFAAALPGGVRRRKAAGVAAASASPFDELNAPGRPVRGPSQFEDEDLASLIRCSSEVELLMRTVGSIGDRLLQQKFMLWNLIQEIEPLDLSVIQKDVAPETVDAMKRTISGMLGLLPSDQFRVVVEAFWNPFFKLLVSSIMTGYTLRNAEYRLSFERNLELSEESEEDAECPKSDISEDNHHHNFNLGSPVTIFRLPEEDVPQDPVKSGEELSCENMGEELGDLTPQAEEYIDRMQSRLDAMKKELHDLRRKNSALQMQQFVGEEKNDLLDYLRSLTPEKVAELSESSCPGVQEAIHSVVHGLLATLSPKIHSKAPPPIENTTGGALNLGGEDDDCAELVENVSLPFQPLISVPRDYLARLLFWCMLLGHYIRGLEYRLELTHLLQISSDVGPFASGDDHVL